MKVIVITGSTRGIGYGLAEAFLNLDCSVTVSGSTSENVIDALEYLQSEHDEARVKGIPCNVRNPDSLQNLWDETKAEFGKVDVWINNAGISNVQKPVWNLSPEEAKRVVETNVLGTIYGSMVAIDGMLEQGFGSLYNMEGMGSDGRTHDGLTIYGMTKYGIKYFTDSLVEEMKDLPLMVGALRPGMVVTDLITKQYQDRPEEWEKVKRIFNILAERVEIVAPWLAQQIMANDKTGVRISYTSRTKLLGRVLMAPFKRRNVFDDSM